eukprot:jgi/Mesvir1/12089/Mv00365-RA.1
MAELEVIPSTFKFLLELHKETTTNVVLHNRSESQSILFKIQTTKPKKYCVRPHQGMLTPSSSMSVEIIMASQDEWPQDLACCGDRFQILSGYVHDDDNCNPPNFKTWKSTHSQKVKVAYFVPASLSPSLQAPTSSVPGFQPSAFGDKFATITQEKDGRSLPSLVAIDVQGSHPSVSLSAEIADIDKDSLDGNDEDTAGEAAPTVTHNEGGKSGGPAPAAAFNEAGASPSIPPVAGWQPAGQLPAPLFPASRVPNSLSQSTSRAGVFTAHAFAGGGTLPGTGNVTGAKWDHAGFQPGSTREDRIGGGEEVAGTEPELAPDDQPDDYAPYPLPGIPASRPSSQPSSPGMCGHWASGRAGVAEVDVHGWIEGRDSAKGHATTEGNVALHGHASKEWQAVMEGRVATNRGGHDMVEGEASREWRATIEDHASMKQAMSMGEEHERAAETGEVAVRGDHRASLAKDSSMEERAAIEHARVEEDKHDTVREDNTVEVNATKKHDALTGEGKHVLLEEVELHAWDADAAIAAESFLLDESVDSQGGHPAASHGDPHSQGGGHDGLDAVHPGWEPLRHPRPVALPSSSTHASSSLHDPTSSHHAAASMHSSHSLHPLAGLHDLYEAVPPGSALSVSSPMSFAFGPEGDGQGVGMEGLTGEGGRRGRTYGRMPSGTWAARWTVPMAAISRHGNCNCGSMGMGSMRRRVGRAGTTGWRCHGTEHPSGHGTGANAPARGVLPPTHLLQQQPHPGKPAGGHDLGGQRRAAGTAAGDSVHNGVDSHNSANSANAHHSTRSSVDAHGSGHRGGSGGHRYEAPLEEGADLRRSRLALQELASATATRKTDGEVKKARRQVWAKKQRMERLQAEAVEFVEGLKLARGDPVMLFSQLSGCDKRPLKERDKAVQVRWGGGWVLKTMASSYLKWLKVLQQLLQRKQGLARQRAALARAVRQENERAAALNSDDATGMGTGSGTATQSMPARGNASGARAGGGTMGACASATSEVHTHASAHHFDTGHAKPHNHDAAASREAMPPKPPQGGHAKRGPQGGSLPAHDQPSSGGKATDAPTRPHGPTSSHGQSHDHKHEGEGEGELEPLSWPKLVARLSGETPLWDHYYTSLMLAGVTRMVGLISGRLELVSTTNTAVFEAFEAANELHDAMMEAAMEAKYCGGEGTGTVEGGAHRGGHLGQGVRCWGWLAREVLGKGSRWRGLLAMGR